MSRHTKKHSLCNKANESEKAGVKKQKLVSKGSARSPMIHWTLNFQNNLFLGCLTQVKLIVWGPFWMKTKCMKKKQFIGFYISVISKKVQ